MRTLAELRIASATHAGHHREKNEDRLLVDAANGIFAVADGLGGQAAGEVAAEMALRDIHHSLAGAVDELSQSAIRRAITDANNHILAASQESEAWRGMACVLTVVSLQAAYLTWGHVGDTRLYLFHAGVLRKLTSDHSPVGEQEDSGALEETEAMAHPLRNEIYRDVGSVHRELDDLTFVETGNHIFPADAVLVLCSDGLTDSLTAGEIATILEEFNGDPDRSAQLLVAAANEQSGADNISVIVAAGPEFAGVSERATESDTARHAITRVRENVSQNWKANRFLWLVVGIVLGWLFAIAWDRRAELTPWCSKLINLP